MASARVVPGARVLDAFCANGAFAFESARLGATRVVGSESDPARVECGRLVATILRRAGAPVVPEFAAGDIDDVAQLAPELFDVALLLGGLYHIEDPVRLLRKIRRVTVKYLILQTNWVLPLPGNLAWFFAWPRPGRRPVASDIPPGRTLAIDGGSDRHHASGHGIPRDRTAASAAEQISAVPLVRSPRRSD